MLNNNVARVILVMSSLYITSCVMPQPMPTRTGKPEAIFGGKGLTHKKIVDKIAYYMISDGFKIDRVDEYSAIFIKHGSVWRYNDKQSYQEAQDERVTLNMLDTDEGINVIGTVETLNYPDGRGPIVDDESLYSQRAQWLFDLLWRVKSELGGEANQGLSGK